MTKAVGVLALQGCIAPHLEHLKKIGCSGIPVRTPEELGAVDGIILPGGESTTMLKLLEVQKLFEPLKAFVAKMPSWGICAGSILLAREVTHPSQHSLEAASIRAERNAYGSQLDSFQTRLSLPALQHEMEVDFIRAPRLTPLCQEVEILARFQEDSVLLRDRHLLCASFHTELGRDSFLHEYFVKEFIH